MCILIQIISRRSQQWPQIELNQARTLADCGRPCASGAAAMVLPAEAAPPRGRGRGVAAAAAAGVRGRLHVALAARCGTCLPLVVGPPPPPHAPEQQQRHQKEHSHAGRDAAANRCNISNACHGQSPLLQTGRSIHPHLVRSCRRAPDGLDGCAAARCSTTIQ